MLLFLKSPDVGLVFWLLGLVLSFVIMYALFSVTVTKPHKPDTRHALHGGWLIPVVATQSVVVLGACGTRVPDMDGSDPLPSNAFCAVGTVLSLGSIAFPSTTYFQLPMSSADPSTPSGPTDHTSNAARSWIPGER